MNPELSQDEYGQWSSRITLFLHEAPEPTEEQWDQLAARDITVVFGTVESLRVGNDALTVVILDSGQTIPVDALAVGVAARSNAEVLEGLGIVAVTDPAGFGTTVPNDPATGATAVPGVWLAGNVGDFKLQVVTAAASGVWTGAMVNMDTSPKKPPPLSPTTVTRSVRDPKLPTP